jgi:hypothetical protein
MVAAADVLADIIPSDLLSQITLVTMKGPPNSPTKKGRTIPSRYLHKTQYAYVGDLSHVKHGNRMHPGSPWYGRLGVGIGIIITFRISQCQRYICLDSKTHVGKHTSKSIDAFLSMSSQLLCYPQIVNEMPGKEKKWLKESRFDCTSVKDVKNLTQAVREAFAASERIRRRNQNHQDAIFKELSGPPSDEEDNDDECKDNEEVVGAKRRGGSRGRGAVVCPHRLGPPVLGQRSSESLERTLGKSKSQELCSEKDGDLR